MPWILWGCLLYSLGRVSVIGPKIQKEKEKATDWTGHLQGTKAQWPLRTVEINSSTVEKTSSSSSFAQFWAFLGCAGYINPSSRIRCLERCGC